MSAKTSNLGSDDDFGINVDLRHLQDNPVASQILASLPNPVFILDAENQFQFLNHAAEMFFQSSQSIVFAQELQSFIAPDSPLFSMLSRARNQNRSVADQGLELAGPKVGYKLVNVQITPFEGKGRLLITMQERALAERLRGQSLFRGAARSVTSMAAMLAHEVKNPLAGIKGAAQLLEADLEPNETSLTRMIVEETDRVTALLDRMEGFAGGASVVMTTVNIHEVLDHCLELAAASYGAHLAIKRAYDPSLPFVEGHRDLLIQAFINIIKNASEATDKKGELIIRTSYSPGRRLSTTSIAGQLHVPIQVEVIDNGRGIPEDIRDHLFDPFVSGRVGGSGLGLAMVASVIADHGGLMEVETVPGETVFRLNFPATTSQQSMIETKNEETAV